MTQDDPLIIALGHAVATTDLEGIILNWNAAAEVLYGWTAGEAVGRPLQTLAVARSLHGYPEEVIADLQGGRTWSSIFTARRKDDTTFLALVTASALHSRSGELVGIAGASLDLGQAVAPFLHRSREAAIIIDAEGYIQVAMPAVEGLLGWRCDDLVGKLWWDLLHADDQMTGRAVHEAALRTDELLPPVEQRVLRADGSYLWVDASKTNLLDEPIVRGVLVTLRDVTERHEHLEDLTRRALYDSLTGLRNREVFMEHVEAHVARRQHGGAVVYLDLDRFKSTNDRHGHEAGDTVLRTVAARLREVLRPEDICARLGGDEFAVLSPDVTDPLQAIALAQRIRAHVSAPVSVGEATVSVQASVGVTLLTATCDADQAVRLADRDMYAHKRGTP